MKLERTYSQVYEFRAMALNYIAKNNDSENKLCAALRSVLLKQVKKHVEDFDDQRDDLQLNNCAVDERTKVILKDDKGNRQYTVEAEKKLKAELKELSKKTVEFHSRIPEGVEFLIKDLTEEEKEIFSGIVIPEQPIE